MKKSGWLVALGCAWALAGCTTTINYTPPAALPGAGKTPLRVAVYDFADRTDEHYTMHWNDASPWKYDNVGEVVAYAVAGALARCGHFGAVERVRRQFEGQSPVTGTFDLFVVGEVKHFRGGAYPHPTIFINPICLGYFLGLPTVYGYEEGVGEASVVILKPDTRAAIEKVFIKGKFGPDFGWYSLPGAWSYRQGRGQKCLAALEEDFRGQLRKRLDGSLGHTLLAMAGAGPARTDVPAAKPLATSAPDSPILPLGKRWALVVGISEYKNTGQGGLTRLRYAKRDAQNFAAFLPYDADPSRVASTGIRMEDLTRNLKAERVVVMADACHSAGAIGAKDGERDLRIRANPIHDALLPSARVGTGRLVFTASRTGETSRESADWGGGHGVFTHFLLLGLRGEADLNRNGTVTVGELTDYVDEQVRRATRSAQNPAKSGNLDRELPLSARPSRNP